MSNRESNFRSALSKALLKTGSMLPVPVECKTFNGFPDLVVIRDRPDSAIFFIELKIGSINDKTGQIKTRASITKDQVAFLNLIRESTGYGFLMIKCDSTYCLLNKIILEDGKMYTRNCLRVFADLNSAVQFLVDTGPIY